MGKTMTRDQLKRSKYSIIDQNRKNKYSSIVQEDSLPAKERIKKKWKPHSEIEIE